MVAAIHELEIPGIRRILPYNARNRGVSARCQLASPTRNRNAVTKEERMPFDGIGERIESDES